MLDADQDISGAGRSWRVNDRGLLAGRHRAGSELIYDLAPEAFLSGTVLLTVTVGQDHSGIRRRRA
jgi:hypothetical protein